MCTFITGINLLRLSQELWRMNKNGMTMEELNNVKYYESIS